MMKTFFFLLHVMNAGNETSTFVLDYNLSKTDCYQLVEEWKGTLDQYSNVECVTAQ